MSAKRFSRKTNSDATQPGAIAKPVTEGLIDMGHRLYRAFEQWVRETGVKVPRSDLRFVKIGDDAQAPCPHCQTANLVVKECEPVYSGGLAAVPTRKEHVADRITWECPRCQAQVSYENRWAFLD